MKRFPILIAVMAVLVAMVVTSCKTTEDNYRKAYQAAVEQRQESTGLDSTIYGRIRNSAIRSHLVVEGDSLPLKSEYVGYTDGGGATRDNLKRYNIVVGQFRQVFNARQMRERLMGAGYPDAMIVHTREPLYYVITETVSTPDEALKAWRKVEADRNLVLKAPLPFVLRPSHFR